VLSKLPLIAMLVLLPAATPIEQAARTASFCERLAPKLGMKPNAKRGGQIREGGWEVSLVKGLGPVLFGGSFNASFSVEPLDATSVSEHARLKDACDMTTKGVVCKITGPARLTIGTKAGKVDAEALPGERADVEMRRATLSCHDG
jgi:hypothetical protein